LIGLGAYYYYSEIESKKTSDVWSLVPENSLIVYENSKFYNSYNKLVSSKIGKTMLSLEAFNEFNSDVNLLDTVASDNFIGAVTSNKFLISIHTTSSNSLGALYYSSLETTEQKQAFTQLIDHYKSKKGYSLDTRVYQGESIYELTSSADNDIALSYYVKGSLLAISETPFLVEDVVRVYNNDLTSFKADNINVFEFPKLNKDEGNVYVNTQDLNKLLEIFINDNSQFSNQPIAKNSFLDLKVDDQGLILNGFSQFDESNFLAVLSDQKSVSSNLKNYITNDASYSLQFSFNNSHVYFNKLEAFFNKNKSFEEGRQDFERNYDNDTTMGADWVGNTSAIVSLSDSKGELFYLETSDVNEALNDLNTLGESVMSTTGDSVYVERYADYEIRELDIKDFVKYSYNPIAIGVDKSYYTTIDNYIVFSNSILNLKDLIDNVNKENTWGRSVVYNKFIERTLQEHNISLIINTQGFLENIKDSLKPVWAKFLTENIEALNNFQLQAYQLSRLDDSFYSSIVLEHSEKKISKVTNFEVYQQSFVNTKIASKPYVVKNHISNLREIVVFDSANNVNLISNNGQLLWSKALNEELAGDLEQVDYYKNNKLQYFFTTKNNLHILDRNGNPVEGFPVNTSFDIAYSKVIDYDNSKRYRFLIADNRGNIYLYNKDGNILDGWGPRSLSGPFSATPFHIRVRRKDAFVSATNDGEVTLLNRKGQYYPGFPLDLEGKIDSPVDVKMGSDFESTILTTITREGQLIKFNMNGNIIESTQLYKPNKESTFKIVSDALGKSFVIVRQDLNRVVMLSSDGKELFAKDYLNAEDMRIQYYDFNSTNKLYVITDKTQGFTYIYKNDGKLINSRPIDSEYEVGVIYSQSKEELSIYCTSGNSFKILKFN